MKNKERLTRESMPEAITYLIKEYKEMVKEAIKLISLFMDNIQSHRGDTTNKFDLFKDDFIGAIYDHHFSSFTHYCTQMSESDTRDEIWDNLSNFDKVLQFIKTNTINNIDETKTNLNEDKNSFNSIIEILNDKEPPLAEDYNLDYSGSDFDIKEFEEITDITCFWIIWFMDIIYLALSDLGVALYEDARFLTKSKIFNFDDFLNYCNEMSESDAISELWNNLSKFEKVFQWTKKVAIENICYTMDAMDEEMSHLNSVKDQLQAYKRI